MPTQVEKIQSDIAWIEESIQNATPLGQILSSNSPHKDIIVLWAEKLEELAKLGVYQKPLSTISAHISNRLKEMNLSNVAEYVRYTLPFKYKDISKIHSTNELESREVELREISSNANHTKMETKYLALLELEKECVDKIITKFQSKNFLSDLNETEIKTLDELLTKLESTIASSLEIIDERNSVPFMKQFLFFYARTQTSLGNTYSLFVKHLREFADFTTKQTSKIADGRISNVLLLYEPKNRHEAMDVGFYGMPCEQCGSWRTKPKTDSSNKDKMYCFKCGTWSELKTEKLPGSD